MAPHYPPLRTTPLLPLLLPLLLVTACCAGAAAADSSTLQQRLAGSSLQHPQTSWEYLWNAVMQGFKQPNLQTATSAAAAWEAGLPLSSRSTAMGAQESLHRRTLGAVHRRTLGQVQRRSLSDVGTSRDLGWSPQDDRYLLATCLSGGLSDQFQCVRKSFYLAGILNRTLLVPDKGVATANNMLLPPWDWTTVVDFERMRKCLEPACGSNTVRLVSEYLRESGKDKAKVDYIHCASAECFHTGQAKALQDAAGGLLELPRGAKDTVFEPPFSADSLVGVDEVAKAYGKLEHEILSLGDVKEFKFETPGGGLSAASPDATCPNMWRPHPAILSFVDGILDTLLGGNYAAVYWKRGQENQQSAAEDERPKPRDVPPVTEVAARVRKALEGSGVSVLYVATDARKAELATFEALLKDGSLGKKFAAILSLHAILVDEEWLLGQFWSKTALEMEKEQKNGVALALVDKYLCARAKFFVGTASSKFSNDILEIRKDEGLANGEGVGDTF